MTILTFIIGYLIAASIYDLSKFYLVAFVRTKYLNYIYAKDIERINKFFKGYKL